MGGRRAERSAAGGRPLAAWARRHWHRLLVHAAALAPLAWLAAEALRPDASPTLTRDVMLLSGSVGLALLAASLACTPLTALTGWGGAVQVRRTLGLYSFCYATLHLLVYAALDTGFDPALIWRDMSERRSMAVGLVSFLALAPLAATSTAGWQRRLGRRWKALHRLVYLAAPLAVLHYLWLDRDFIDAPLAYAAIVAALLALRLPAVRRAIVQARRRLVPSRPAATAPPDDRR